MSYGQRTFFDRRTHQRRAMMVARLSYPFFAARYLADESPEDLTERVLEHLRAAQEVLQRSLGAAELARRGGSRLDEVDPSLQALLRQSLGEEAYRTAAAAGPLGSLPPEPRQAVAQGLGRLILSAYYRDLLLAVGDRLWVEYLTQMEALRTSIGLEAYGQRDPLVQYKSRAFDMFTQLLADIRAGVSSRLFRVQPSAQPAAAGPVPRPSLEAPQPQLASAPVTGGEPGKKRRRRHH
jgi:preprotein translocase subunit SecA